MMAGIVTQSFIAIIAQMEVVDLATVRVQPLQKGSVLHRLIRTSMQLGGSMLGSKVTSLRQR